MAESIESIAPEKLQESSKKLKAELAKIIVGQQEVIEDMTIAIFCAGHSLVVGVPGLAKTLIVRSIAQALDLKFKRIQFTPDLMPSDITGTEILVELDNTREFKFTEGPVFANILLADEINRTPPKTQAALLEAMEEKRVTVGGTTYELPKPFFVLATENPIEQEGTYPLPEAQLDRFMFSIRIGYPTRTEECEVVRETTKDSTPSLEHILSAEDVIAIQHLVRKVPVSDTLIEMAVSLVASTRPDDAAASEFIKEHVRWGAGPRASQHLVMAAKARAVLRGELSPTLEDLKNSAESVLRHRIIVNFRAQSQGITPETVIEKLCAEL